MSVEDDDEDELGVTTKALTAAMADVGNNWERTPLRHGEGREGWEESLVGCIKDVRLFGFGGTDSYLLLHSMLPCQVSQLCDEF